MFPRTPPGAPPSAPVGAPLAAAALLVTLVSPASSQSPEDLAAIAALEASVPAAVQVEGRPTREAPLARRMEELGVPGVSVAFLRDGEVVWARAWGVKDAADGGLVTPETLFQAASISKPVAALAALHLADEGRLDLDADVGRYLESWTIPSNPWTARRPVTLRGILSHTAGLTQHGFPGYAAGVPLPGAVAVLEGSAESNTPAVVVDTLPGELWRYSGGGYTVLQVLLEDVTGRPFAELMEETVLEPGGMVLSTYEQPLPRRRWDEAAHAHDEEGRPIPGDWHTYPEMAAAGLWTTPTELLRVAARVQAARAGDRSWILDPATARDMLEPVRNGYGLGFGTDEGDDGRFGHGGSNRGFKALLSVEKRPGGEGMAVMANGERGGILNREIQLALAREYGWDDLAPRTLSPVLVSPETRAAMVGRYGVVGQDVVVEVRRDGDRLVMDTPDGPWELIPLAREEWGTLPTGNTLEVVWDGDAVVEIRVGPVTARPLG